VGYCLVGFLAGSAYSAVESKIGTALAIAVAAVIVAALAAWSVRRHRVAARAQAGEESAPGPGRPQSGEPGDAEAGGPGELGAEQRGH
jgi:hypothetical protein